QRLAFRSRRARSGRARAVAGALAHPGRGRHHLARLLGGPRDPAAHRGTEGKGSHSSHGARGALAPLGPCPPPALGRHLRRPDLRPAERRPRRHSGRATSLTPSGRSGRISAVSPAPLLSTYELATTMSPPPPFIGLV